MVSVERVLEYSHLPQEPPFESTPDQKPPSDWPKSGEIMCQDVCFRYSLDGPLVLKDLTFTVRPREKVNHFGLV